MRSGSTSIIAALLLGCTTLPAAPTPVLDATVSTAPLASYDDAPATPDSDDPAIWVDRARPERSLILVRLPRESDNPFEG